MRPSVLGTLSVLWETVFSQGKCLLLRTLPACLFVRGGHICTHDPVCLLRPCLSFSIYDAISLLDALSVLRSTVCPREPVCPLETCLSSEPLSVLRAPVCPQSPCLSSCPCLSSGPLPVLGAPVCPPGPCLSSGAVSVLRTSGAFCPLEPRLSLGNLSVIGGPACHLRPCLSLVSCLSMTVGTTFPTKMMPCRSFGARSVLGILSVLCPDTLSFLGAPVCPQSHLGCL